MSDRRDDFWFPAKTFGYGWGLPRRWQGWVVLLVYVGTLIGCAARFPPGDAPLAFGICVAVATALLVTICALKGEPPSWRGRR
ncbi:hypothetical protein V3391_03640 [Luteimonas sp. SMYT11W]|uniref:DUF4175 domain-containing protein n=1 Tax=Luteimonas flava TaxID=3115822 RepID=A0ABU7WBG4_9GAMM